MTPAGTRSRPAGGRRLRGVRIACLLFLAPLACDSDGGTAACDRPGDYWCDGNAIVACLAPTRDRFVQEPALEHGVDCADYGGTCVEWRDEREFDAAGCAVPDGSCGTVGESICLDDRNLGYCQPAMRYIMYGCGGDYCQVNDAGEAVCRLAPGACSSGDMICDPDDPHGFFKCGSDGTWAHSHECAYEEHVCTQISETDIDCGPP